MATPTLDVSDATPANPTATSTPTPPTTTTTTPTSTPTPTPTSTPTPTPTPPTQTPTPTPTPTNAIRPTKFRKTALDEPVDLAILQALSRKATAGRRPGAVWEFFTAIKTAQNRTHATCNFCARRCAGVASRMIDHILDKCPSAPTEATEALVTALAQGPPHKRQRVDRTHMATTNNDANNANNANSSTSTNNNGGGDDVVSAAAVAVGLAAFRAHVANGNTSGLLLLDHLHHVPSLDGGGTSSSSTSHHGSNDKPKDSAMASGRPQPNDALTVALHKLVVACLRRGAPLALLEDDYFRDALALLKPGSAFALKHVTAAALLDSVHASVVHDATQWMRTSESFTLVHQSGSDGLPRESDDSTVLANNNPTTSDSDIVRGGTWRGADDKRHAVLFADRDEQMSVVEFVQSHVALFSETTVLGLCCDSPRVYHQLVSADTPVALWSQCLVTQSCGLWSLVAQAVPQIASVALGAAEIASMYASHPQPQPLATSTSTEAMKTTTSGWSVPFAVIKRVLAMSQSLKLSETQPGDSAGVASAAQSAFWSDLVAVDALLAPFAWLFALGESRHVSSSQCVVLWSWLLASIARSPLLLQLLQASEDDDNDGENKSASRQRETLISDVLRLMDAALEDHHLVALLLDPRLCGVGLSATGRRKAKAMVVHVATRLWPAHYDASAAVSDDHAPPASSSHRQSLLTQLGHFMDKTAYFADEIAWEMARGSATPETFWRDYAQDAPELARLAIAVLTFVPVASAADWSSLTQTAEEPLSVRQTKFHFAHNRKNSIHDLAAVLAKYGELLAPVAVVAAAATPSPVIVTTSSAQSPPLVCEEMNLADAVNAELARLAQRGSIVSSGSTVPTGRDQTLGIDRSWFAVWEESEETVEKIQLALRNLVPPSILARPAHRPVAAQPVVPLASQPLTLPHTISTSSSSVAEVATDPATMALIV